MKHCLACLATVAASLPAAAPCADIQVMISAGFHGVYAELAPAFERASGHRLVTTRGPSMGDSPEAIPTRLARGESADVVIMDGHAADALAAKGLARADTRVELARSQVGMVVKAGAARPDIGTVEAFKKALLAAKSIAYSDSGSGTYLSTRLFPSLGLADQIAGKSRKVRGPPSGEPVAAVVARGEAEIGFQQVSELIHVPGADFVGALPAELQPGFSFAGAVTANAREPAAAMALLRFLASSDVAPMLVKKGLAPPAAQIRLLSAGAVATGMKAAVAAFEKESGNSVKATFNTAPQLAARLEAGELYDLVVAPPAAMQRFAAAGKVGAEQVPVGRVGMGVATRGDAPQPGLANMDTFQVALLEADSIVFNRASSGQYFEGWLKKRDLYERLEARITRYADAGAVMEHVLKGKGREFAVGPTTEIIDYRDKGLKLVGPLPAEIQNYTEYVASPGANASEAGRALLRFLGTPPAKAAFTAAGIE